MTPQEILALLKTRTHTDLSDADAYIYLNIAQKQVWNDVVDLDKNYWWDWWNTDLLEDRSEYFLKEPNAAEVAQRDKWWQLKIERVFVKYNEADTHIKCDIKDFDNLDEPLEYYKTNQPYTQPFVILADNSIFVYPQNDADVTDWILLEGTRKPYNRDATTTSSADVLIPELAQELVMLRARPYVYEAQQLWNEKANAEADYERERKFIFAKMAKLMTTFTIGEQMDLEHLE